MNPLYEVITAILIFWLVIFLLDQLFRLRRFGVEVFPLVVMAKTKRLNHAIGRIARKWPRAWKAIWTLGAGVGYIMMGYVLYFLLINALSFFLAPSQAAPVIPIIPGITITGMTLVYFIFPLMIVMFTHELSHGVAAIAEDIPVKSSGVFVAAVLPGAFVEVDEEKTEKANPKSRLRIYAAGSFSNLGIAVCAFLLISNFAVFGGLISPFFGPQQGILIQGTVPDSPIYGQVSPPFGLFGASAPAENLTVIIESAQDFIEFMDHISPGDTVILETDVGFINVTTSVNPNNDSRGFVGVQISPTFPYYPPRPWGQWLGKAFPYHLYQILLWTHIIAFSVGIMNLLPIPLFDGDRLLADALDIIVKKRSPRAARITLNSIRIFALSLLILNILLTVLSFPLQLW